MQQQQAAAHHPQMLQAQVQSPIPQPQLTQQQPQPQSLVQQSPQAPHYPPAEKEYSGGMLAKPPPGRERTRSTNEAKTRRDDLARVELSGRDVQSPSRASPAPSTTGSGGLANVSLPISSYTTPPTFSLSPAPSVASTPNMGNAGQPGYENKLELRNSNYPIEPMLT